MSPSVPFLVVVLCFCVASFAWQGDIKGRWIKTSDGFPSSYSANCMFSRQGSVFVSVDYTPRTILNVTSGERTHLDGTYVLRPGSNSWTRVTTDQWCTVACDARLAPYWCYSFDNVKRPTRFNPDSFNGTYEVIGPASPFFRLHRISVANGVLYSIGDDQHRARVQRLNLTSLVYEVIGGMDTPQSGLNGAVSPSVAVDKFDAVYHTSTYFYSLWRWSPNLQMFQNITFDIDMDNLLGFCCGLIGNVATDPLGEAVYASTQQGLFLFRGSSWQKVLPYYGLLAYQLFGNYMFAQGVRYEMPGPVTGVNLMAMSGLPSFNVSVDKWRWELIVSPNNDGETVVAIPRVRSVDMDPGANVTFNFDRWGWTDAGPYRLSFPSADDSESADLPTQTTNFVVSTATYLGSTARDDAIGVHVANISGMEVTVVGLNLGTGGVVPDYIPAPTNIGYGNDSSRGYLLFFNTAVPKPIVFAAKRVGSRLLHMRLEPRSGRLILTTTEGVTLLEADHQTVRRQLPQPQGPVSIYRAVADEAGKFAVAIRYGAYSERHNFTLYDQAGTKLADRVFSGSILYDIEMAAGNVNLLWVSGFAQLSVQAGAEYQRASIHAYSTLSSSPLEYAYCQYCTFNLQMVRTAQLLADTRVTQLVYSLDGYLYFTGLSAGGWSIFLTEGRNINSTFADSDIDYWTTPINIAAAPNLFWYAKADPLTGDLLQGQWRLSRLPSGKGNTLDALTVSMGVAPNGAMYFGGLSACCMPGRDFTVENAQTTLRVNCKKAGRYVGDTFILKVHPSFQTTEYWTSLNGPLIESGAARKCVGITAGAKTVVALFQAKGDHLVVTENALQVRLSNGTGDEDAYLVVWPHKQPRMNCSSEFLGDLRPFVDPDLAYAPKVGGSTLSLQQQDSGSNGGAIAAGVVVALLLAALLTVGIIYRKKIVLIIKETIQKAKSHK